MTNTDTTNDQHTTKITIRVDKLLTLAADPRTPDEERFTAYAKAADLMTRHGIDQAMLNAAKGNHSPEPVETHRFEQPATGGHGKARVLSAGRIAEALGCQCAYYYLRQRTTCHIMIIGVASDIATVRRLLPLITSQAEHAAIPATRAHLQDLRDNVIPYLYQDPDAYLRRERRTFYRSFLESFGATVATRIAARRKTLSEEATTAGTGAELVLIDRADRVKAAFTQQYPKLGAVRRTRYNQDGINAGRAAGHRADLGDGRLSQGQRPALPH